MDRADLVRLVELRDELRQARNVDERNPTIHTVMAMDFLTSRCLLGLFEILITEEVDRG